MRGVSEVCALQLRRFLRTVGSGQPYGGQPYGHPLLPAPNLQPSWRNSILKKDTHYCLHRIFSFDGETEGPVVDNLVDQRR